MIWKHLAEAAAPTGGGPTAAERLDVAIVGAGPFGLSVAAHLRHLSVRTFGASMATWRNCMPPEMLLRSAWEETSLAGPGGAGSIDEWVARTDEVRTEPIPLQYFLRYADWFRATYAGTVDPSDVTRVEAAGNRFRVQTAANGEFLADRVVIAVGVMPFAYVPPALHEVFGDRAGTAPTVRDADKYAGRRLLVIGGGQAGLESAGLAAQAGADVELVTRSRVHWFADREPETPRGPLGQRIYRLAYPAVGYGPPPLNRLVLHPDLFAALPFGLQRRLTRRLLRPGGSPWLRPLVEGKVRVREHCTVASAERRGDGFAVVLTDGGRLEVDDVLIACGYRFDLERLGFLAPPLRERIATRSGWPVLDRYFRSTDEGIFFVGYPAEGRFGPISRFVLGTGFTARRVSEAIRQPGRACRSDEA
jgi:pyruvate/2-oxoglutarate dehydrogenase complex dihydrolipoamide dehydrogenase (E3) component